MLIDRVNEALAAFGGGSEGNRFSLGKDGECVLERDGGECVINTPVEGRAFTLSAVVGFIHRMDTNAFLAGLLQLNSDNRRTRGGSLSLDESGEVIVYRYLVDGTDIDGPSMVNLIANFFAVTDNLRWEILTLRDSVGRGAAKPLRRRPGVHGYLRA